MKKEGFFDENAHLYEITDANEAEHVLIAFEELSDYVYHKIDSTTGREVMDYKYKMCKHMERFAETHRKYMEYLNVDWDHPCKFSTDNFITVQFGFRTRSHLFFYGRMREIFITLFETGFLKEFSRFANNFPDERRPLNCSEFYSL